MLFISIKLLSSSVLGTCLLCKVWWDFRQSKRSTPVSNMTVHIFWFSPLMTDIKLVLELLSSSYSYLCLKKGDMFNFSVNILCKQMCYIFCRNHETNFQTLVTIHTRHQDTGLITVIHKYELAIGSPYLRFFCNLFLISEALAAPSASLLLGLCFP
jgi:hypothetical protein